MTKPRTRGPDSTSHPTARGRSRPEAETANALAAHGSLAALANVTSSVIELVWSIQPFRPRQPALPADRVDVGLAHPLAHRGLGEIDITSDARRVWTGWRTSSTTSALNAGVNDRRGR